MELLDKLIVVSERRFKNLDKYLANEDSDSSFSGYLRGMRNIAEVILIDLKALRDGTYQNPVPDYGDVMTKEDFIDGVKSTCFTDYDGIGNPAKEVDGVMMMHPLELVPSMIEMIPEDATHVVWYNK